MIARNILAVGVAVLALSSCTTITHTSQTAAVDTQVYNLTVADLNVAAKKDSVTLDWKWNPLSTVSLKAQKESATHKLLSENDADVLVEPQYIVNRRGIFRGGSVTVTGYPASYTDFRAMTTDDAEKIATVNGESTTVLVNPVIATTAGKVIKPARRERSLLRQFGKETISHQFVNVFGGAMIDISGYVDVGYQLGAMYGSYGNSWGWYGKLALNSTICRDNYYYSENRKWTPEFTVGAIKTLGAGFNMFFGAGVGGYYRNERGYDEDWGHYYDKDKVKFSIPVEIGFMKRFKCVNVMIGATYATPLSGSDGNINPFAGIGYSF